MKSSRHTCFARLPEIAFAVSAGMLLTAHSAAAQSFEVLHSFAPLPPSFPLAPLLADSTGNLYGTTSGGGGGNYGTVFKLDTSGTLTTLHSFNYLDGANPQAGLIHDGSGNLFGTTSSGGANGFGTVFRLDTSGTLTTLHNFNDFDGAHPFGRLIQDGSGDLFGTTFNGGTNGVGTVFRIDSSGTLTTLHSFQNFDGANPVVGVIQDASGNLYGTARSGGAGIRGTVFKLSTSGTLTTLHSFNFDGSEGFFPSGVLTMDSSGNLYGTTIQAGPGGGGTVFKLDTSGTLTTLHAFGLSDGANPSSELIQDGSGNFYGATSSGGADGLGTVFRLDNSASLTTLYSFNSPYGASPSAVIQDGSGSLYGVTAYGGAGGLGTVFRLDTSGTLTTLHSFSYYGGAHPYAGLTRDGLGNLYGSTYSGGSSGYGTVFKLDTSGALTTLNNFDNGSGGAYLQADLVQDGAGNLYGTTTYGGAFGHGTIFRIDSSGTLTTLHSFNNSDGSTPQASLLWNPSGNLFGTTATGGANSLGTIFKVDTSGTLTTLHSFNNADGAHPFAGLVQDGFGNLFGTTKDGGASDNGTVFKLDTIGTLTTLHSFSEGDGAKPQGALIQDASGNLYGTTLRGGEGFRGTIFKLDASDALTTLHSFNGSDGSNPQSALIQDGSGNLYGTTFSGGLANYGTIFKLDVLGSLTTLHSFTYSDGANPYAGLIQSASGYLYGTTYEGGAGGTGVIFRIALACSPPTPVASGSNTICAGGSTPLSGSGGVSCSWSPATGLDNPSSCTPTANPVSTTIYTLTVTDASGCVSTNAPTVTVTVTPTPSAVTSGGGTINPGGSVQLNGSGGVSCSWSPATGLDDATSCSPVASPSTTTSYSLQVVNAAGCPSNNETSVTVVVGATMITEYVVPASGSIEDIVAGPDGALWFTGTQVGKIGRITPGGVMNQYAVPTPQGNPFGITVGPDGALWFPEENGILPAQIGRINTSGQVTEFVYEASTPSNAFDIATGSDGNLWFTVYNTGQIGRMTPTGTVDLFPVPWPNSGPYGIVAGPDGALWFTDSTRNEISRVTTSGQFSAFAVPTSAATPYAGITVGPDGALWFTELNGNQIGRMTTAGFFTEFPIPTANAWPWGITAGPDGNLWFTEASAGKIGRITPAGVITEYPLSNPGSQPHGITQGPDGAIWFVEGPGYIGRVSVATPSLPSPWVQGDIGAVGQAGSAAFSGGAFTVSGSGAAVGGTSDQFHYVYQTLTGDGEVKARILSVQNASAGSRAGVMIRDGLAANAAHAMMSLRTDGRGIFQRRLSTGATSSTSETNLSIPYWVRLVRSGNTFTAYRSSNGTSWTGLGSPVTIPMGASVSVGLAVTSANNSALSTCTFSNVTVTQAPPSNHTPVVTAPSNQSSVENETVTLPITASDSDGDALTYSASGLPGGLSIHPTTGIISGTISSTASSGSPYTVMVTATDPSLAAGSASFSWIVAPGAGGLPSPWVQGDIGAVGQAGSAAFSGGAFTVSGSGAAVGGTSDQFHYVYQTLTGDGEVRARILSVQNASAGSRAGVMIRDGLAANAAHAMMSLRTDGRGIFQRRLSTGATSSTSETNLSIPYWVRLVRSGNTFTAYRSSNGTSWTGLGSPVTIPMGASVSVGLAVTSANNSALSTCTFSNVTVTQAPPSNHTPVVTAPSNQSSVENETVTLPITASDSDGDALTYSASGLPGGLSIHPTTGIISGTISSTASSGSPYTVMVTATDPSLAAGSASFSWIVAPGAGGLPSPWVQGDIGAVGQAGSAAFSGGAFTVSGSGAAVGGTSDQFHYVYQTLTGDGEVRARILSVQNASAGSRAGVMIRDGLAANAAHAMMSLRTDGRGIFQRRLSTGATSSTSETNLSIPYWVRLVRSGNTFTAYRSSNGTSWTGLGSPVTIPMGASVSVGLAVTSANNSALSTCTFSNVTVTQN